MTLGSESVDASVLDLDKYDLPGLRTDIQDILDLPSAIERVAKQSLRFVVVGIAVVWLVFASRMPIWALVPYALVVSSALVLAAAAISMFLVLRTRLDATDRAADRTLFTVAAMHGDIVQLQADGGSVAFGEVASFLTKEVVFPVLVGSAGSMIETTATAAGPLGWFSSRLLKSALNAVERRVLAALDLVVGSDEAASVLPTPTDGMPIGAVSMTVDGDPDDVWSDLDRLELREDIRDTYVRVHGYLSRVVDGVEVLTSGGAGVTTAVATIPLVILLVLGWLLT